MEEEWVQQTFVPGQPTDARKDPASSREGPGVRDEVGTAEPPYSGADRRAAETRGEGRRGIRPPVARGFSDAGPELDPGLKEALDKLAAYAKEFGPPKTMKESANTVAFPIIRRTWPRQGILNPPLRRAIDYQSTARKSLLFFFCDECGGMVEKEGAHEGDPDACDLEKVRQVMEW
jgi:hypothetical protein